MKKTFYFIAILISLSSFSKAQPSGTGFTYNFIRGYCIGLGYGIGQEWHSSLEQGQYFTKTFTFNRDVEYNIIALSEDLDVLDVDIQVYTDSGDIYAEDTSSDRFAEVNFTPSYTRTLTIKVKNYSSNTPNYASKVYFLIAYKE